MVWLETYLELENMKNGEESEKACTAAVPTSRVAAIESCMVVEWRALVVVVRWAGCALVSFWPAGVLMLYAGGDR